MRPKRAIALVASRMDISRGFSVAATGMGGFGGSTNGGGGGGGRIGSDAKEGSPSRARLEVRAGAGRNRKHCVNRMLGKIMFDLSRKNISR